MASVSEGTENGSPFVAYERETWAKLSQTKTPQLSATQLEHIQSTGDLLDTAEVAEVYHPLAELLGLYIRNARALHEAKSDYLGDNTSRTPFVIGIAGSVAVGKSTTSRVLRELLMLSPATPQVELVTTDGFLLPTAELERRGILHRKGFPESYDRRGLLRFISQVKGGAARVEAPRYSHLLYDRVPGETDVIESPDVLIVEGLNVLAPPSDNSSLAISDLFDFGIYVDARPGDIAHWYEERFLQLQQGAFSDPRSYFHKYASLTEDDARAEARRIWNEVNAPNLENNIQPTRPRASLILRKESDHRVHTVLLRKI